MTSEVDTVVDWKAENMMYTYEKERSDVESEEGMDVPEMQSYIIYSDIPKE